jgi:hypothetical protein
MDQMAPQALREITEEIAHAVVDAFSSMHPHIRMNLNEWCNLREMIDREVTGAFGRAANGDYLTSPGNPELRMGAHDLLK